MTLPFNFCPEVTWDISNLKGSIDLRALLSSQRSAQKGISDHSEQASKESAFNGDASAKEGAKDARNFFTCWAGPEFKNTMMVIFCRKFDENTLNQGAHRAGRALQKGVFRPSKRLL